MEWDNSTPCPSSSSRSKRHRQLKTTGEVEFSVVGAGKEHGKWKESLKRRTLGINLLNHKYSCWAECESYHSSSGAVE